MLQYVVAYACLKRNIDIYNQLPHESCLQQVQGKSFNLREFPTTKSVQPFSRLVHKTNFFKFNILVSCTHGHIYCLNHRQVIRFFMLYYYKIYIYRNRLDLHKHFSNARFL